MVYILILSIIIICGITIYYKKYYKSPVKIKAAYPALDIAKYIVSIYDVNNIQLQKVLLYLQLQYMKQNNCLLFNEYFIKKGNYYVIDSVYLYFLGFGSMSVYYKFPDGLLLDKNIQEFILNELDPISNMEINDIYKKLYEYNRVLININDLRKIYIN